MAAFTAVSLPPPSVDGLPTVAPGGYVVATWAVFAYTGNRLGHVRVRIWNGTAWVDAPPS